MIEIRYTLKLFFTFFVNKQHLSFNPNLLRPCLHYVQKSLKTLSMWRNLKTPALGKRWGGGESHEYRDFFLKQKFKLNGVIVAFLRFSRQCQRHLSTQSDKFNFHLNEKLHTRSTIILSRSKVNVLGVDCWLVTDFHINNDDSLRM